MRKKFLYNGKRIITAMLIATFLTACSSEDISLSKDAAEETSDEGNTDNSTNDTKANSDSSEGKSTDDSTDGKSTDSDITVDSVTWDDSNANPASGGDSIQIFFNMSDGSVQTFETDIPFSVDELQMVDLSNDGTDDYIIVGWTGNTAAEYQIIYAYTFEDGQVSQLFPVSGIDGIDDDELYDCQITDVTIDYSTDETVKGLELSSYDKVEGMAYTDSRKQIYYKDGEWNLEYDFTYDEYEVVMSPRDKCYIDLDEESSKLYQDFLDGNEKITYDAAGDNGEYIEPSQVLTDGDEYTFDEIVDSLTSKDQYSEGWAIESVTDSYIDCGLDGAYEMVVSASFETEFSFDMVIKNIDGSLKMCYFGDSWSRSETTIRYNGMIYSYGSGGASSHGGHTGFINADGEYKLWYKEWEEGYDDYDGDGTFSVQPYINGSFVDLIFDIPGAAYIYSEEISFSEDVEYDYYYFYILDEDSNELIDDPNDSDNPYEVIRKECEKKGITAISEEEHLKKTEERRQEVGLTDEIYEYGDEYLPEDE